MQFTDWAAMFYLLNKCWIELNWIYEMVYMLDL